jgi:hypothetical protein
MTIKEFIQSVMLVFIMIATSVVLPIGLVVGSASDTDEAYPSDSGLLFVFDQTR